MTEYRIYYRNSCNPKEIITVLRTTILSKAFDRAKETAKETGKIVAISALDLDNCKLKYSFVYPD